MYKFRRWQSAKGMLAFLLAGLLFLFLMLFFHKLFFSDKNAAKKAVTDFYTFESAGEFSSSWEMFHPWMKEKFDKRHYIQDRAHVFLDHFDVETFHFTIGKPEKLKKWNMEKNREELTNVYKVPVEKEFNGKYGNFTLHQNVYAVKIKNKWFILWSYEN